jgi:hypothetical protein
MYLTYSNNMGNFSSNTPGRLGLLRLTIFRPCVVAPAAFDIDLDEDRNNSMIGRDPSKNPANRSMNETRLLPKTKGGGTPTSRITGNSLPSDPLHRRAVLVQQPHRLDPLLLNSGVYGGLREIRHGRHFSKGLRRIHSG